MVMTLANSPDPVSPPPSPSTVSSPCKHSFTSTTASSGRCVRFPQRFVNSCPYYDCNSFVTFDAYGSVRGTCVATKCESLLISLLRDYFSLHENSPSYRPCIGRVQEINTHVLSEGTQLRTYSGLRKDIRPSRNAKAEEPALNTRCYFIHEFDLH